jgi:YHS domain-containing protein
MLLRTLLIVVLVLLIVRFVWRLMQGIAVGMSGPPSAARTRQSTPVKMVADPVCGTYVVPGKALQATRGRETHYFCSDTCRAKWEAS